MLIMHEVGIRSARHFVHRSVVVGVGVRKEGAGGDEEGEVEMVEVDWVELRRRKGMLGRRYSGKGVVGDEGAMVVS